MDKHNLSAGPLKRRVISLFFLGLLLMAVVEIMISWICGEWGRIRLGSLNQVFGPVLTIGGITLVIWSVLAQYRVGEGTPAPMVATQKLVTSGLYSHTRNPMTLGAFFLYAGIGLWMNSGVLIILSLIIFSILFIFIYIHETRELRERFGAKYLEYRKSTPFLIPSFSRKHKE